MIDHELQFSDILSGLYGYLFSHLKDAEEEYTDNSSPVFFYGHEEDFIKMAERIKKRRNSSGRKSNKRTK